LADQTDNGERPKKSEFPTTLRFTPPLKHLWLVDLSSYSYDEAWNNERPWTYIIHG
jgi:hypothetical protein